MSESKKGGVIVVGASSGIGEEIAKQCAAKGHAVAVLARRKSRLDAIKSGAPHPERVFVHEHDVCMGDEVPALWGRIIEQLGDVETIYFAAGVMPDVGPDEYDFAKDQPVIDIGLTGAIAWLNQAARHFQMMGQGRICGISSIAGDRGRRAFPSYHAAKAGLTTFLESLRNRLSQHGVSVTTIKPGFIDTDMTKGREGIFWLIGADAAAKTIIRLTEKGAGERYVPARWGLVGRVVRAIPSFIFRRLDF